MAMRFEELDERTRQYMLTQFEAEEQSGRPYRGARLSPAGRVAFPNLMREAMRSGTEQTLITALAVPAYWQLAEMRQRLGSPYIYHGNLYQRAESLGLSEFNIWYVRGLARRLMDEHVAYCEVYRAAPARTAPQGCSGMEGSQFPVEDVYHGHRAHYWPPPGKPYVFMIPFGAGCHHTIRRVR